MMEDSLRVTAATAQMPQLPKLGAQWLNRTSGAVNLMKCQEYPMRISMFALSASMSPALTHSCYRWQPKINTNTERNYQKG